MKNLKTFEESKFRTVNSSDMENWDPKTPDNEKYTGTKDLDIKLGNSVIELLKEYRLSPQVGAYDWLHRHGIVLEPEKKFKEYRVSLGTKQTFEDWLDWEHTGTDYENLSEEEQLELENEYDNVQPESDNSLEFSVFLPPNTKNLEASAFSDASQYLKLLSESMPEMFKEYLDPRSVLSDNTDGFKAFINNKKIQITNKNIEIVNKIEYRLYKDSKFFGELREFLGDYDTRELITEWLKLIK